MKNEKTDEWIENLKNKKAGELFTAGIVDSTIEVKEILNRTMEPTTPTLSLAENEDFLSAVTRQSNYIHRKSLRGPAHLLILNQKDFGLQVSKLPEFKKTSLCSSNIKFADADWVGILNNRYSVFVSNEMDDGVVLLGREGEGLEYEINTPDNNGVPTVNVAISKEPHLQTGQIGFWGYIKL